MMSPKGKITVMIADDTEIAREGLRRILETSKEIRIIGEATTSIEAARMAIELKPQVVIMDLKWFGDENAGWRVIREIKMSSPDIRVIAMTAYKNLIKNARLAGADVGLLKMFSSTELIQLIESISQSDINMSVAPIESIKSTLTNREIDVLRRVAEGLTDNEISNFLGISTTTVKNQIGSILSKLGAVNRTHAIRIAHELKLLE